MANNIVVCKVCGKPVKAGASVANACGTRCNKLLAQGVNAQVIASAKQAYSVTAIPAGFITIAALHRAIAAAPQHGASVAKMVASTGGDRPYLNINVKGIGKFANAICVPLIAQGSKTRMLPAWLATPQGMQAIASGVYTGAPKPHALQLAIYNKAK